MKVFVATHQRGNAQVLNSKTWYNNLYLPWCDVADEVIFFTKGLDEIAAGLANNETIVNIKAEIVNQVIAENKLKKIDIFFSYFDDTIADEDIIKEIKSQGIFTINWYCNASYQFERIKNICKYFDLCLVPEFDQLQNYIAMGANVLYCQEAANPNIYKPNVGLKTIDVSFCGSRYGNRKPFMMRLAKKDIYVDVFGPNWEKLNHFPLYREIYLNIRGLKSIKANKVHGTVTDEELINIFNSSKINLGLTICGDTYIDVPVRQVRLRDFEIPMCGGFYLTEMNEELHNFYEADKEVVFFQDEKECADKVKYFLKNDVARNKIADAAYRRSINEHTWQQRFKMILKHISL
ncbi:MAG: glycosyltransferase [Bacteroidota bacterium]|nr:glycosyltransferase [Bacteroidota bacterium]